jgi:hypothetical protein
VKAFRCKDWVGKDVVLVRKVRTSQNSKPHAAVEMTIADQKRGHQNCANR